MTNRRTKTVERNNLELARLLYFVFNCLNMIIVIETKTKMPIVARKILSNCSIMVPSD